MTQDLMTDADRAVAVHFVRGEIDRQWPQEAVVARKQIGAMAAEIAALSKQIADLSAANDKLQSELDEVQAEFNGCGHQR